MGCSPAVSLDSGRDESGLEQGWRARRRRWRGWGGWPGRGRGL